MWHAVWRGERGQRAYACRVRFQEGSSAVLWASYSGHVDIVKFLIGRGANIMKGNHVSGARAGFVLRPSSSSSPLPHASVV